MDESARVSAVVLTYNGREMLEVILPSLAAQRFQAFTTLVVDNGSQDDSVEWLRTNWPAVKVVALPENLGVSAALNVCVQAAETELICLLNNDMELDPDCLGELVRELDAHPRASSVAAKLLDYYDRRIMDGAGDIYTWSGEANRRGQGEQDSGQYSQPRAVFGACGAAALYRRSALTAVGGFDEDFFAIYEDVDWSFRAQLRGYECRYAPRAVAFHMGSATLGRELSDFVLYHNWRNGLWVILQNYPAAAFLRHGHTVALSQAHNLVWTLQSGRFKVFARVWRDVMRSMPATVRKRRAAQRSRTVGLRELERLIGVSDGR